MKCRETVVLLTIATLVTGDLKLESAHSQVKHGGYRKDEAYVTLLYRDYLLPVRVLGLSLKLSGTQREMVVLCTDDVSAENRKILEGDGWKIKQTNAIETPYTNHAKQYDKVFTKLLVWTLTEYRRIVFMDSDTLVYDNIDELFRCGSFCAAYRHSDLFNSGVFVVKPDLLEYRRLINKIGIYPSYDNTDQGFLNYYYQSLIFAPMFNASDSHNQEEPMRLPAAYNADVGQYYACTSRFFPLTKFKVLHHTLGPVKPWKWWAYPIFDLNWQWVEFRDKLEPSTDSAICLFVASAINLLLPIIKELKNKEIVCAQLRLKLKGFQLNITVALIILLSYTLGFTVIPDSTYPFFAIPALCLWTHFFLQLFCFCVTCLISRGSQVKEFPFHSSILLAGVFPLMPLIIPLYISAFFIRVCAFLTLLAFDLLCSHFLIMRSLDKAVALF